MRRLVIALPPRHLKSFCASIAFTTWMLRRDPTIRIICASHSGDLAQAFSLQARKLIKTEWFASYEYAPKKAEFEAIEQSWDTAAVPGATNDWSVCTTWGLLGQDLYLLDLFRDQLIFPDFVRAAETLRKRWTPRLVAIEKATSGIGLPQKLRRNGVSGVNGGAKTGHVAE